MLCYLFLIFSLECGDYMINKDQFQIHVIEATLHAYDEVKPGAYSENAVALLMGTAAQESVMGTYLVQIGSGTAKGFFQVEQATALDNWINYLRYQPEQARFVRSIISPAAAAEIFSPVTDEVRESILASEILDRELTVNLMYNCLMARIKYLRVPHPLPSHANVQGMAEYWDTYYNANGDHGFPEDFIKAYEDYVL